MKSKFLTKSIVVFVAIIILASYLSPIYARAGIEDITLAAGWTTQLSVSTKKSIKWSSSDTSVASVSKSGLVKAKNSGYTVITAEYEKIKTKWIVRVIYAEEEIVYENDVSKPIGLISKKTLYKGQTYTLKLNGISGDTKWISSDKSIATVSSKGKVTARKKGTVTITASIGKKKYKCKITVKPKTLYTNKKDLVISMNKTKKIIITLKTNNGDNILASLNASKDRFYLATFDEEPIIDFVFGDWDGDDIPLYITAKAKGEVILIIETKNTKEKIKIPITVE